MKKSFALATSVILVVGLLCAKTALSKIGVVNIRNCSGKDLFISYCDKEGKCKQNLFKLPNNQHVINYRCKVTRTKSKNNNFCRIIYLFQRNHNVFPQDDEARVAYEKEIRRGRNRVRMKIKGKATLSFYMSKTPRGRDIIKTESGRGNTAACRIKKRVCEKRNGKRRRCRKEVVIKQCLSKECLRAMVFRPH